MSEFKNRIITISGEPVSGKSTVINKLKEDYEKQGYNVHIFSVGHEFRRIAQEKGLSIEDFNEYMIKRGDIDKLIDSTVAQRGKEINMLKRPDDVYIFDSRLAFHNIPDSFSVRLTVDDKVAGERVFKDNKRGKEDIYNSVEEAIEKTHNRKGIEVERYKKRYGIDLQNSDNYNLVIDTSFSSIDDISRVITECLELELENKEYTKMWTSPKKLLPLQSEFETLGKASYTLEEMIDTIKKEGYDPNSRIEVLDVDNKLYIYEGHHRNFASGYIRNTLVPYTVVGKDDECVLGSKIKAKQYIQHMEKSLLWGHEQFFDEPGKPFSYNHIYPGIYEELTKEEKDDFDR